MDEIWGEVLFLVGFVLEHERARELVQTERAREPTCSTEKNANVPPNPVLHKHARHWVFDTSGAGCDCT